MGLELTTDRYPPITSQTRYPLRHAAAYTFIESKFDRYKHNTDDSNTIWDT